MNHDKLRDDRSPRGVTLYIRHLRHATPRRHFERGNTTTDLLDPEVIAEVWQKVKQDDVLPAYVFLPIEAEVRFPNKNRRSSAIVHLPLGLDIPIRVHPGSSVEDVRYELDKGIYLVWTLRLHIPRGSVDLAIQAAFSRSQTVQLVVKQENILYQLLKSHGLSSLIHLGDLSEQLIPYFSSSVPEKRGFTLPLRYGFLSEVQRYHQQILNATFADTQYARLTRA